MREIISAILIIALFATSSMATPATTPAFTHITDPGLLKEIKLGPSAWCYNDAANAVLITAPVRATEVCNLKTAHEIEKEKIRSRLIIDNLTLRVSTLEIENKEMLQIKDEEISRMTDIIKKLPANHSTWWAIGGFSAGVLTTILITHAVTK